MFPYFAIFGIWCEDKVNSYSGYSAMQMGFILQALQGQRDKEERSGTITTRLCYHFTWCVSEIPSVKPTKVNWDPSLQIQ